MPPQKVEHDLVEAKRLLPGHGVAGIVNDGPFVISQMCAPDAHQGWWCQKIGVPRQSPAPGVEIDLIFANVCGVRRDGDAGNAIGE